MRSLIILAMLPLAACSTGHQGAASSGTGTTRQFAVTDFNSVALKGSDDVEVKTGSGFSVRAQGPSDVLDKLLLERDGDTLKIGRKPQSGFNWGGGPGARIFVTMPRLASAALTGSGDLTLDRVDGDSFNAETTGSGSIRIGQLAAKDAAFSVTGSGDIGAAGKADKLDLSITGSGDIDAAGVSAAAASASIAGSGSIRANVSGRASVSILGSGDADMGNNAVCTINKLGSGDVHCGK